MPLFVKVRAQFAGFHKWGEAPDAVAFLRDFHRHVFHVGLTVAVGHGDRAVEFFTLQNQLKDFLRLNYTDGHFTHSCEMIAEHIGKHFENAFMVEVSEDGENAGIWTPDTINQVVEWPTPTARRERMAKQVVIDDPEADKSSFTGTFTYSPGVSVVPDAAKVQRDREAAAAADRVKELLTQVKTKPFVGVEAEGPRRGVFTLFIPGGCSPNDFRRAWAKVCTMPVGQVYYGAGNDRRLRSDTMAEVLSALPVPTDMLCIEADSMDALNQVTNAGLMKTRMFSQDVMVVLLSKPDRAMYGNTWYKSIDGDLIRWEHSTAPLPYHTVSIKDPTFKLDRDVDTL